MEQQLMPLIRLVSATLLGMAIGFERKMRLKEAGMRTHALVCVGACLMTIISVMGFPKSDGSRVAAQIVSGMGFLGAGIIMLKGETLKGLTTAAGIWATAGVGMAVGSGLYLIAAVGAVLIIGVQIILHLNIKPIKPKEHHIIKIQYLYAQNATNVVKEVFKVNRFMRFIVIKESGQVICVAFLRVFIPVPAEFLTDIAIMHDNIISVERLEEE